MVIVAVFSLEVPNRFHNQENVEDGSDAVNGKEAGSKTSPEMSLNGKYVGFGSPEAQQMSKQQGSLSPRIQI